jgi:hypothetical protein
MRDKKRLIEVINTINLNTIEPWAYAAFQSANCLLQEDEEQIDEIVLEFTIKEMTRVWNTIPSPHYEELADEVLIYLEQV